MEDPIRYAKKDIYAEVEEEGGPVNRLVATKGDPVSAAFAAYVKDEDTTTDPTEAREYALGRSTSARKLANTPGDEGREERSHEEYRDAVGAVPGVDSELAGAVGQGEPATDIPEGIVPAEADAAVEGQSEEVPPPTDGQAVVDPADADAVTEPESAPKPAPKKTRRRTPRK